MVLSDSRDESKGGGGGGAGHRRGISGILPIKMDGREGKKVLVLAADRPPRPSPAV